MIFQVRNVLYKPITGKRLDLSTQRVVFLVGKQPCERARTMFVVFHLGSRVNNQVDNFYKWMEDSVGAIVRELEEHPEYGCLGSEHLFGVTVPL